MLGSNHATTGNSSGIACDGRDAREIRELSRTRSGLLGGLVTRREFACAAGASILAAVLLPLEGCSALLSSSSASGRAPSDAPSPNSHAGQEESGWQSRGEAAVSSSAGGFDQISTTLFAFDTVVTLTASCSQQTLNSLAARCEYFESKFSRTRADSDIGRVNAAQGKPVEVSPETADIVSKALDYCKRSNGLFDITIGAVSTLWDFKEGVVPEASELARAVKHVDYTKVQVEGDVIQLLDSEAKLDLGGIAKGYIADDLCKMLVDSGCSSGFVNLGGNVKTVGVKPDGKPWHVGIQDPNDVNGSVVAAVYAQSNGTSVVTSGLYERQFRKGGKRYWHILDPKTGYPVETDLVSATIVSALSIDGDGLTKPLFMMGHDKALEWLENTAGIEGLLVDSDGAITQSSGCAAQIL